jgi:hypothetical protein
MADQVTCVSSESNYFRQCLGEGYTPVLVGKHEGVHPQRVREAMAAVRGTLAADVIAALVFDREVSLQRQGRMAAGLSALQVSAEGVSE